MVEDAAKIPTRVAAGDTIEWSRVLPKYRAADGWSLGYTLVGSIASYSITAASDGDSFAVTVSAAMSAAWQPGTYCVVEYVTNGDRRHTLSACDTVVAPNLAAATTGIDTRSHARKVLDNINAWLERKAPAVASWQLGDRQLQHYPLTELLALRDRYAAIVARDEGSRGARILTRL